MQICAGPPKLKPWVSCHYFCIIFNDKTREILQTCWIILIQLIHLKVFHGFSKRIFHVQNDQNVHLKRSALGVATGPGAGAQLPALDTDTSDTSRHPEATLQVCCEGRRAQLRAERSCAQGEAGTGDTEWYQVIPVIRWKYWWNTDIYIYIYSIQII